MQNTIKRGVYLVVLALLSISVVAQASGVGSAEYDSYLLGCNYEQNRLEQKLVNLDGLSDEDHVNMNYGVNDTSYINDYGTESFFTESRFDLNKLSERQLVAQIESNIENIERYNLRELYNTYISSGQSPDQAYESSYHDYIIYVYEFEDV